MIRTLERRTRRGGAVVAAAVVAALAGLATPAQAGEPAESASATADPVRIDFGNGITGSVDPESSRMTTITTPTPAQWDAVVADQDFYGFGDGWTLGTYFMPQPTTFYLPGVGTFDYDVNQEPSHLYGYYGTDFVAQHAPDGQPVVLPARDDIPEQAAWWTLTQVSTGITAYFTWERQLVATIDKSGARTDWVFERPNNNRSPLERIIEPNGDVIYFAEPPSTGEVAVLMPNGTDYYLTLHDERVWSVVTAVSGYPTFTTTSMDLTWSPLFPYSHVETRPSADGPIADTFVYWQAYAPRGTVTRISDGSTDLYPLP